jgi:hypothetical protein
MKRETIVFQPISLNMSHQTGRGVAVYKPARAFTLGYRRRQRGANFFKRFGPALKGIGKKVGAHALNTGLAFLNDVIVNKSSPKDAIKRAAMNELNKAIGGSPPRSKTNKSIKKKGASNQFIPVKSQRGKGVSKKSKKKKKKISKKGFLKIKL